MNAPEAVKPWYKQFWPWFLIALPMTAVIASFITLKIAMTDSDGLVKDDYYKEGLAVNVDKAKKHMAEQLGVKANAEIDPNSGSIMVSLNDAAIGQIDSLVIKMIHPTRAGNDMIILVRKSGERTYTGQLTQSVNPGFWWIRLSPENDSWYLEGRLKLPKDQKVLLQ